MPSAFSFLRSSMLNSISARAMPSFTASAWPFTPPPETRATTLNVAAVSVETSGCFALERCAAVTKYCSKGTSVDLELAAARTQINARHRRLAASRSVILN